MALAAAKANIGPRYQPIHIQQWDATRLPLEPESVSTVAVNPPFGRKIGSPDSIRELYPRFLREMAHVVRPGGRVVVLTDHNGLLAQSIRRLPLRSESALPVRLLGHPAVIRVFSRV